MTRINTIDPQHLLDQHLFIEFREITRIATLARPLKSYGDSYVLGTGHMKFFYNKGAYLSNRLELLQQEMDKRGRWNYTEKVYKMHGPGLNNNWQPDSKAHMANLLRLSDKLVDKPDFYTLNGKSVSKDYYSKLLYTYNN